LKRVYDWLKAFILKENKDIKQVRTKMTSPLVEPSTQTKGAVFEFVVRKLIEMNDYEKSQPDNEQVDINGRIRGRGERHQIDAFGRLKYTIPFVYPIRLFNEIWPKNVLTVFFLL
jgi:hypothetical protein